MLDKYPTHTEFARTNNWVVTVVLLNENIKFNYTVEILLHGWFLYTADSMLWWYQEPGLRFNIKMSSYRYRKSHCGDKTVVRSSYLHNGISYTGEMSSFLLRRPPGYKQPCHLPCYIYTPWYTNTSIRRVNGFERHYLLYKCAKNHL